MISSGRNASERISISRITTAGAARVKRAIAFCSRGSSASVSIWTKASPSNIERHSRARADKAAAKTRVFIISFPLNTRD